jgi:hypothetical protein
MVGSPPGRRPSESFPGTPGTVRIAVRRAGAPRSSTHALVEVVDVLGDQEQLVADDLLEPAEGDVSRVGVYAGERGAAGVVELVHHRRLSLEALGRGDVLDPVALPEPVGVAERRHPALGGDAGAGQHDDAHQ